MKKQMKRGFLDSNDLAGGRRDAGCMLFTSACTAVFISVFTSVCGPKRVKSRPNCER